MNEARGFEGMGISSEALDRHITGNYGEDAMTDECDECVKREDCPGCSEDCGGPYDMGDLCDAAEMLMGDR